MDESRYPVQARMNGRDFARFHVDVGIGDEVLEPLDVVTGRNWLAFAGLEAPSFPAISAEQQFAEKRDLSPQSTHEARRLYQVFLQIFSGLRLELRATGRRRQPRKAGRSKSGRGVQRFAKVAIVPEPSKRWSAGAYGRAALRRRVGSLDL
jgi:hypothetical protein